MARVVMRRPFPLLVPLLASKPVSGILENLLKLERLERMKKEHVLGVKNRIANEEERLRVHRRLNIINSLQGLVSNNISQRGYESVRASQRLSLLMANTHAMNFSICLSRKLWYYYVPSIMFSLSIFTMDDILNPEKGHYNNFRIQEETSRLGKPVDPS